MFSSRHFWIVWLLMPAAWAHFEIDAPCAYSASTVPRQPSGNRIPGFGPRFFGFDSSSIYSLASSQCATPATASPYRIACHNGR